MRKLRILRSLGASRPTVNRSTADLTVSAEQPPMELTEAALFLR
ncbi:hypothetical protein EES47_26285 [Streptomyces sp. ADI98-12]|nr:hypothetical protein [Streptomyces rutgersensis]RPK82029.1 hypothetical protein EES47_26285 [Streptomyces sp. ADI98-12]